MYREQSNNKTQQHEIEKKIVKKYLWRERDKKKTQWTKWARAKILKKSANENYTRNDTREFSIQLRATEQ